MMVLAGSPSVADGEKNGSLTTLRNQFPLLREVAYFQTGSLSPLADSVRDATFAAIEAEGISGLAGPGAYQALHRQQEGHRVRLAGFLGVEPTEIGWTTNTTTAIRHAIGSLPWRAGDTLITTNREHISTRSLQDGLRQRHDATIAEIDASGSDDLLLSELEKTLSTQASPRLLLISHVSCQDGRRLPVAETVRLAHAHDVPVLVDEAQSLGQFPVDLRTLGCDMLVGSAHKWLFGPAGLGFLYVAHHGLVPFSSPFAMAPVDAKSADAGNGQKPLSASIELGTAGMAARAGLAAALNLIDGIGLSRIEEHVAHLTAMLRDELASISGVTILSPSESDRQSGITSFTIDGSTRPHLDALVSTMWDTDRVMAKVQVEQPSIRVSIAAFNKDDDILQLTRALRSALATLT